MLLKEKALLNKNFMQIAIILVEMILLSEGKIMVESSTLNSFFSIGSTCYKTKNVKESFTKHGYSLISDIGGKFNAVKFLQNIGILMPQHTNLLEHEVRAIDATKHLSYSQSANTIQAHTEAPGWHPEPDLVALYCHKQARCGAGHTGILHIDNLLQLLSDSEIDLLFNVNVNFPSPNLETKPGVSIISPVVRQENGFNKIRFSYNLFKYGSYYPDLSFTSTDCDLPLGKEGSILAEKINNLFENYAEYILIPDDALFIWDNTKMLHARSKYQDINRHLTRYWLMQKES